MYKLDTNIDSKKDYLQNRYQNKSQDKLNNYLTDSSCNTIQKILRDDYFSRLQKASLNNLINYVTEDDNNFKTNKNIHLTLDNIHKKPIKQAAKQIVYSNMIRKNNFNRIKKHPRKNLLNMNENKSVDNFNELIRENNEEDNKPLIFKIKKVYKDKYPIKYDLNYIDEVENKFIKPYLSKNNVVYHDYIVVKKSKTPFNFIIG